MQLYFLSCISYMTFIVILAHLSPSTKNRFLLSLRNLISCRNFWFLESYNPHLSYSTEADPLEIRIADAVYAAEDAIETHIVDKITNDGENISSDALYGALEKVIIDMASIEKKAMKIQVKKSTPLRSSASSSPIVQKKRSMMVGADGALLEMKDKLTSHCCDLQIIPIVGMGGTGKTTIAINICEDRLIKEHFDICVWATISQEYNIRHIFIQVLKQLIKEFNQDMSEGDLGEMLHKHLYGRRYLVVMDDMWSIDAWDGVRRFFPDNKNGSRIVITTRLSNLASKLSTYNSLEMGLLDEAHSWILLSKIVFGERGCPPGFEVIGKKIGKGCKGLPLSIVAVGGFMAKSEQTMESWKHVEENLNSIVNLEDDERCLQILYLSYKELPVYLKPCFLYMGVFPEDDVIRISKLVRLWVAKGFLKPVSGKSLKEIAKEYLKDLIDRNLVIVHKMGSTGNMKECKIHDLLRDLCWREAKKERFYSFLTKPPTLYSVIAKPPSPQPQGIVNDAQRRIVISSTISRDALVEVLSSTPHARSLVFNKYLTLPSFSFNLMLLRILHAYGPAEGFFRSIHQIVNARMLSFPLHRYTLVSQMGEIPSSISLAWNLQTLCVADHFTNKPTNIWHVPHIRHVQFPRGIHLPDPPVDDQDDIVFGNLQTMGDVRNFKLSEQMIKRIPNIKKLKMSFLDDEKRLTGNRYCLTNLDRLDKLETLTCKFRLPMNPSGPGSLPRLINFSRSLRKLSLYINDSPCSEEILEKIGMLPLLQKLRLLGAAFKEMEWITTQGQFPRLKLLHLGGCKGLKFWRAESSHFPCLERLVLDHIYEMEIPLEFAQVSTLRVIELTLCKEFVINSAKMILEERKELYGEEEEEEVAIQVRVTLWRKEKGHDSLASPNFRFKYLYNEGSVWGKRTQQLAK